MKSKIYDDRSQSWETMFRCNCGGHVITIDRWIEKNYVDDQIFINFWYDEGGSNYNNSWWNRIKNAFSVLRYGGYHKAEVIMESKDMQELVDWFTEEGKEQFSRERKNYYPKEVLWSVNEGCWVGRCRVFDQMFQCKGDNELEVFAKLSHILDQHLDQPNEHTYCLENMIEDKSDE